MLKRYYIFLTHCVCDIGGMQLYVSRKVEYLKSQGWHPLVFYYKDGEIKIPNLKEFENNYMPILRYCVGNVSEKKRKKAIAKIKECIQEPGDVVVESCCLALGTWGEYIALHLQGKHILYIIDEVISSPTKEMKEFLDFKLRQRLVYCISPKVIQRVWPEIQDLSSLKLTATGAASMNVAEENSEVIDSLIVGENTILSLGRLDKPYISHLFDSIAEFAKSNNGLNLDLIIVGDTPNSKEREALLAKFNDINNLKVHYLGYLWPIPRRLFNLSTVAVGSAGSIVLCSRQGVPSISIDGKDYEAIGLVGISTQNSLFRGEDDLKLTISEWLQQVIVEKKYSHYSAEESNKPDYTRHQEIIDAPFDHAYYPTHLSTKLVSHPILRSIMIAIDQSKYGHAIFNKLWGTATFNNLVAKVNRTDYQIKK